MNFLIEINAPTGWQHFLVKQGVTLEEVMSILSEHYQGDEIHDVRIKRLNTEEEIRKADRNVQYNWRKQERRQGRRQGRSARREH